MGVRGLIIPLSSTPPNNCNINLLLGARGGSSSLVTPKQYYSGGLYHQRRSLSSSVVVGSAKKSSSSDEEEPKKKRKQNLFESVTEALDFSQVRSAEDAQLLEEAREATKSGDKMTREQYGALRRKIGGTYKDFFKSYIDG